MSCWKYGLPVGELTFVLVGILTGLATLAGIGSRLQAAPFNPVIQGSDDCQEDRGPDDSDDGCLTDGDRAGNRFGRTARNGKTRGIVTTSRREDANEFPEVRLYIRDRYLGHDRWQTKNKICIQTSSLEICAVMSMDSDPFEDSDLVVVGAPDDGGGKVFTYFASGKSIPGATIQGVGADRLGACVALEGEMLLVGAPGTNGGEGAAYAYQWDGSTWQLRDSLDPKAGGCIERREFGSSLDLRGARALVGAAGGSGRAFVFELIAGSWNFETCLEPPDEDFDGAFGFEVALTSNAALIGAPGFGDRSGAAFLFHKAERGDWSLTAAFEPIDDPTGDEFGSSVDLDGNIAIVGAPLDDIGDVEDSGATYVFEPTGIVWELTEKLTRGCSDLEALDTFGTSVSVAGGFLFVGAPNRAISGNSKLHVLDTSTIGLGEHRHDPSEVIITNNSRSETDVVVLVVTRIEGREVFLPLSLIASRSLAEALIQDTLETLGTSDLRIEVFPDVSP